MKAQDKTAIQRQGLSVLGKPLRADRWIFRNLSQVGISNLPFFPLFI